MDREMPPQTVLVGWCQFEVGEGGRFTTIMTSLAQSLTCANSVEESLAP
jgi:hypothetical protein